MEQNQRGRALDVGVTLGLIAAFVAASLALTPAAPPVQNNQARSGTALAFDDSMAAPNGSIPQPPVVSTPDQQRPELADQRFAPPSSVQRPVAEAPSGGVSSTGKPEADEQSAVSDSPVRPPAYDGGVGTPATLPTPVELSAVDESLAPPAVETGGSETIEGDWFFDWGFDPGVRTRIASVTPTNQIDAADYGVVANDGGDDHAAVSAAVAAASNAGGAVVVLPAGTVLTSQTISLGSGVVLRGAGTNDTTVIFTGNLTNGVELGGGFPKETGAVVGVSEDRRRMSVTGVSDVSAGDLALVETNADKEAGQVVSIRSAQRTANGWNLTLVDPAAQNLVGGSFRPFEAGRNIGLENLNLVPAQGVEVDYHIVLRGTDSSWVRNVRSEWAKRSHLYTRQTYRCEVRDSTFAEATNKGDGGHGYGINIANNTTGCLFMQNRLALLRHSVLLHGGATANVVAFNTSTDPRHPNFTNGGPADMSFHGYAVGNLVEGNIFERTQLTDAGNAGANNTIVRNCFTSGPITLRNNPVGTSLVGNSILGTNARLQSTTMPAVEWADQRAYTTSNLFDDDGVLIQGDAPNTRIDANWFAGSVSGASARSAFALVELTPTTPTGNTTTDCPYAP